MSPRIAVALAALAACAALAAGCGGGSDSTAAPEAAGKAESAPAGPQGEGAKGEGAQEEALPADNPPGKVRFVIKANATCAKGRAAAVLAAETYKGGSKQAAGQIPPAALEQAMLPRIEAAVAKVAKLAPPEGEQAEVRAYLSAMEEAFARAHRSPPGSLEELEALFAPAAQIAKSYGIKACSFG